MQCAKLSYGKYMQLFGNTVQSSKLKGVITSTSAEELSFPAVEADIAFDIKLVFPLLQTPLFNKLIGKSLPAAYFILEKLHKLICEQDAFEEPKEISSLEDYPLAELWRDFFHQEIHDFPTLLQLVFALSTHWGEGHTYKIYEFMNKEFIPEVKRFYGFDLHSMKAALEKFPYLEKLHHIILLLAGEYWDANFANTASRNILASFFPLLDKGNSQKEFVQPTGLDKGNDTRMVFLYQHSAINYWMSEAFGDRQSKVGFNWYFTLRYLYYQKSGFLNTRWPAAFPKGPLSIFDFGQAYAFGLIPDGEVIKELTTRVNAEDSLSQATAFLYGLLPQAQMEKLSAFGKANFEPLKEVVRKVTNRILEIELKRGEPLTEVSHLAMKLERIEGASLWIEILKAYGPESLGRTDYYYGSNLSKREVLGKLLRACYPSDTDTVKMLNALLKDTDISSERLMEAAVYAPQWLQLVEECIGWKGLYSAAYFFHAHIGTLLDDRIKAVIARFTPTHPEDLQWGAFDIDWYREAVRDLGIDHFEIVYEASKCISSGTDHTRLRKCMDAVNGKEQAKEMRKLIEHKRNKDLLMNYCLIPINKRSKLDLLDRYQYLLQFLKESKVYGSQRQESEKKAVELGMLNLTRNAGYIKKTRLIWNAEAGLLKHIAPCFIPKEREGVKVSIKVDEEGNSCIQYVKAGRGILNNIPAKLRKDPYLATLKEINKKLKSKYLHSYDMLEQAMGEGVSFLHSELLAWRNHPVLGPIMRHIVFVTKENATGFYTKEGLQMLNGEVVSLRADDDIRVAHPLDLCRLQEDEAYRQYLVTNEITQPFAQVDRLFYFKPEEEQSVTYPLPKDFPWQSTGDGGYQKVFYKVHIVASIDAEGHLSFSHRKTAQPLSLPQVPDTLYSEVLSDLG